LFSALQSLLFNDVLERRVTRDTWATVLPGDVAKKHDTGGMFDVPEDGGELQEARDRAEAGSVSATGPMFGAKMRWPTGEPGAIEREVFAEAWGDAPLLTTLRHLGEGTRRALRLHVEQLSVEVHAAVADACVDTEPGTMSPSVEDAKSTSPAVQSNRCVELVVRFVLPKGGYATTVLGRVCHLIDASRSPGRNDPGALTSNDLDRLDANPEDAADDG
jgi:tRNA pseudouridine13 synthase